MTELTDLIDNKRVCLGDIYEYLNENINDIDDNIKNKKYEKALAYLLLIQKHTFKSINRMRIHNVNKTITNDNKANKKSNKAKKKITNDNNANKKNKKISNNNANEKITNANSANEKISNANNANEKITNANSANEKSTDGNNSNVNSTCIIRKKSSITIKLQRPHVIY